MNRREFVISTFVGVAGLSHVSRVASQTKTVAPKVPNDQVGKLIVVSRTSNRLWLYDGFKVERTYPVATARQGFETPPGEWSVVNKVENPTWHNPCLGRAQTRTRARYDAARL